MLQAESLNHSLSQFSSGKVALNVINVPAFGRHTPVNLECVSGVETRKHFHHVSLPEYFVCYNGFSVLVVVRLRIIVFIYKVLYAYLRSMKEKAVSWKITF